MGEIAKRSGLVSVVIPTYNHESYVRETLNSVLAQTYGSFEVIVSDDASKDTTQAILREYQQKYPDKIRLVLSERNTGVQKNLNRALREVRGEYIAWLGGDDLMSSEKLEKQVALLESRPDAVGCVHDAEVFDSDSGKVYGVFSELYNGKRGFREGGVELWFEPDYFMLPSTLMIRSSACPSHGFDERLRYLDWLFDIEVFRNGKCVVINEVLGKYRRHDSNITSSDLVKETGFEESMLALGILEARYPELYSLIKKRRRAFFIAEAAKSFKRGLRRRSDAYIYVAVREGAWVRGLAAYVGLRVMGTYISSQIGKAHYARPAWFIRVTRFIKGGL